MADGDGPLLSDSISEVLCGLMAVMNMGFLALSAAEESNTAGEEDFLKRLSLFGKSVFS